MRGDETGKDGGGDQEEKNITVVTIEIDSLSQSELSSFPRLICFGFFLPFLYCRCHDLQSHRALTCWSTTAVKPTLLNHYQRLRSQKPKWIVAIHVLKVRGSLYCNVMKKQSSSSGKRGSVFVWASTSLQTSLTHSAAYQSALT